MRSLLARALSAASRQRCFSQSAIRRDIRDIAALPTRTQPLIHDSGNHDLLSLNWTRPLRNVLVVRKENSDTIDEALVEFANHIHESYPGVAIILEPQAAREIHARLRFPVYSTTSASSTHEFQAQLSQKVDLTTTLGGDGTILHASSLFAHSKHVPPILSFSMGTLGFLGEWKFAEHKRAFREIYMSGAQTAGHCSAALAVEETGSTESPASPAGWSSVRGKSMGLTRGSRVLVRNRLKMGIWDADGQRVTTSAADTRSTPAKGDVYAMNEVLLHRGHAPHLSVISIHVGGRFLTEAVADGMLVSTPTGSTAYSLSSGGCIVHPLVSSLLLTPICPRSLSFRPLVLPANTPITLRLSERNRSAEVDVSIDGVRQVRGLQRGMEVRVVGEDTRTDKGSWVGGVPSVVRAGGQVEGDGQDHWVGGLNALLKFNYPFGEDG